MPNPVIWATVEMHPSRVSTNRPRIALVLFCVINPSRLSMKDKVVFSERILDRHISSRCTRQVPKNGSS